MRLRLREDPREWMKFTAVVVLAAGAVSLLLWRKQVLTGTSLRAVLFLLSVVLAGCLVQPRWYRPFYRSGTTLSFHVGQVIGKLLLAFFFFLALMPIGILLRLAGKDLLKLKRSGTASSYWQPARVSERFDRLF